MLGGELAERQGSFGADPPGALASTCLPTLPPEFYDDYARVIAESCLTWKVHMPADGREERDLGHVRVEVRFRAPKRPRPSSAVV